MAGRFESALTAIFTERPLPGRVKVHLHPVLGPWLASELAQALLDDVVARCRAGSRKFDTALCVDDAADLAWCEERYPGLARYAAPRGVELGERLASFFAAEWAERPRQSTVALVADAPLLETDTIVAAHRALRRGAELVAVPDEHGGFALLGLSREVPGLFEGVAPGAEDVLARTLAIAREHGIACTELAPSFGVDSPDDLERLCVTLEHRLAQSEPVPLAVATLFDAWGLLPRA
ncbi:MAG: DUF2064 domain-containing protein [Planctomycetes bacterium]|nr:DUF2064 domain-containing protein [Planctomycetota bacterium]